MIRHPFFVWIHSDHTKVKEQVNQWQFTCLCLTFVRVDLDARWPFKSKRRLLTCRHACCILSTDGDSGTHRYYKVVISPGSSSNVYSQYRFYAFCSSVGFSPAERRRQNSTKPFKILSQNMQKTWDIHMSRAACSGRRETCYKLVSRRHSRCDGDLQRISSGRVE